MIGKKYRGESQYGEKVEGWLVRHPLGKVFLIVYKGWDEPRWVAVKEETLEEVPEVEVEFKYNVGDKVYYDGRQYKIKERLVHCGEPSYKFEGHSFVTQEWLIEISAPQDIIECIKTFDDACKWCVENGKREMLHTYSLIFNDLLNSESEITEEVDDLIAYCKLRIITTALNEGWEPTFELGEERYVAEFNSIEGLTDYDYEGEWVRTSGRMIFKSPVLADYAITQFRDIYADFCGCGKGGEG